MRLGIGCGSLTEGVAGNNLALAREMGGPDGTWGIGAVVGGGWDSVSGMVHLGDLAC